jgi:hypothetical protein
LALSLIVACGGASPPKTGDPGTRTQPVPSAAETSERARVASALTAVAKVDREGLLALYPDPTSASAPLGYDPLAAGNLNAIQASPLKLNDAETQALAKNGFVITGRQRFPGFTYGYRSIYAADLPVFVSADSILYAVHRSYDSLLKALETASLRPTLASLLQGMREALAAGALAEFSADVRADADLYLAVPLSLLQGAPASPVAGASAADIADLVAKANAASGLKDITLFGVTRENEDFSQFKPRGHYTDTPALSSYFKAMMWLGRFDERMLETLPDGSQVFRRRQFDGALALTQLLATGANQQRWQTLDTALAAFVGEPDSMQPKEFPALLAQLGVADAAAVASLSDDVIAKAIVAGNFGAQRISSHVMITGVHDQALPLSRSFLLLGQRYVVDSHVFSNVTYDRVPPSSQGRKRMLPSPLDVAFTVFGNNQAAPLLSTDLDTFAYAPALAAMRVLVDDHGDDFWKENIYNDWLAALRALSPASAPQSSFFTLGATEAWGRRLLNTQLASWAELRHDTILYAKQSYSGGVSCVFPDALVEPNPAFFARVGDIAAKGQAVVAALGDDGSTELARVKESAGGYFTLLATVAANLQGMAEAQEAGTPFTSEQMTFINEAVKIQEVCGGATAQGWYPRLFFTAFDATDFHPTIADVHTAPTDEGGNPVGNVLHVGTGYARLMVVTANTCEGPRAFVGLASSYFERVTENLQRLDDPTWSGMVGTGPADVPWLDGVLTGP